jgi:hypothetical protein
MICNSICEKGDETLKDFINLTEELEAKYPKISPTTERNSEELSHLVFSLRIRKKLSQKELAELSGIDVMKIHQIEGGSIYLGDEIYSIVLKVLNDN